MEVQSTFAGAGPVIMGDAFHIDDLLDFSNEDIAGPIGEGLLSGLDSMISGAETVSTTGSPSLTGTKHMLDGDEHVAGDLCVPCDDLAELEWLSKFVEESFSMGEAAKPLTSSGGLSVSTDTQIESYSNKDRDRFQSASPVSVLESSASSERAGNLCRELSVRGRARSKRARTGGRVWGTSARILSTSSNSANDTDSLSSDSNAETGAHSSSQSLSVDSQAVAMIMPKAVSTSKKPWKAGKTGKKGQDATQPWRCMHCSTQRTPQWRAGPMGPKTLCNACGVRFKSGRLLPEYRPAGSPGYIGHKHSNSHKKILEMRRQREQQPTVPQTQPSMLPSCPVSPNPVEDPDMCDPQR